MKVIFNDASELVVQSATIGTDGALLIKTISATLDELQGIFSDSFRTRKMTVTERENTVAVYDCYTNLNALVKYTGGILGVELYKVGESQQERLDALEAANDDIVLMIADLIAGGDKNESA